MATKVINIAKDFTRYPGGRFYSDGPYSGEEFRTELLLPVLESGDECLIVFDGARGYGSSFLEEAFGGLVRAGYKASLILSKFNFKSESDPSLIDEIKDYLNSTIATNK